MKETNEMMEILHQNHKKTILKKGNKINTKYYDVMNGMLIGQGIMIITLLIVFELFVW